MVSFKTSALQSVFGTAKRAAQSKSPTSHETEQSWPKLFILHPYQLATNAPYYIPYSMKIVGWCADPQGIERVGLFYAGQPVEASCEWRPCTHPSAEIIRKSHGVDVNEFSLVPHSSLDHESLDLELRVISSSGKTASAALLYRADPDRRYDQIRSTAAARELGALQKIIVHALRGYRRSRIVYSLDRGLWSDEEASQLFAAHAPIIDREVVFESSAPRIKANIRAEKSDDDSLTIHFEHFSKSQVNPGAELFMIMNALRKLSKKHSDNGFDLPITDYFGRRDFAFVSTGGARLAREKIRSVLVIKLDKIGDVVCSAPALRRLRSILPNAKITLIVSPYTVDVARQLQLADEIIGVEAIGRQVWDIAINLRVDADTLQRLDATHAHLKVSFGDSSGDPAHLKIPGVLPKLEHAGREHSRHIADQLTGLIAGIDVHLSGSTKRNFGEVAPVDPRRLVVCVGPDNDVRSWPTDRFAALIAELVKHYGFAVNVIGSNAEVERSRRFISKLSRLGIESVNLLGDRPAPELVSLISGAAFFVGVDSGPKHIANYFDVPGLIIHGGRHTPVVWGSTSPSMVDIYSPVICSPCLKVRKTDCHNGLLCLENISVESAFDVAAAVVEIFSIRS